ALDFDGTNDYVALGNPAQLQITGDMTIEMWVKPDNFSARRNPYAKAYGGEGTITQEVSGTLSYYYGTAGSNTTPYQGFGSSTPLTLNEWNHIAIVRDLTNMRLYWYINGVLTSQTNANYATATSGGNSVFIGSGYVSNYDGQIDELRVWNTVRTQAEIRSKMCSKLSGLETGLAAYYRFDTGSGSTLVDVSSNGLDGLLTNSPNWVTSSASIGDNSVYLYTTNWTGQSLTQSHCGGESLTVDNMSGSPDGVHIYYVDRAPLAIGGITGLGGNDRYFGVLKINAAAATYTASYDYASNPYIGGNEPTLELFKRTNNSSTLWVNSVAVLNTSTKTLVTTAQGTEFILGSSSGIISLPIELISFEAQMQNNKVELKWLTQSETNNDYFTIERSLTLEDWNEVLKMDGAGNSYRRLEYYGIDDKPLRGVSYYRLKQTDYDGQFSYSEIVAVKFKGEAIFKEDLFIFPNPISAGENLQMEIEGDIGSKVLVILRSIDGREVYSEEVDCAESNETSKRTVKIRIPANAMIGIYLVTVSVQNKIRTQKILINELR
ncbi:MAG: T9SS type A sorting domain-containing protein, partial [Flavobacteriales bacterium]|nr:T9SS type A sorting domain-containing protein [Flavobacteriales bacterium]